MRSIGFYRSLMVFVMIVHLSSLIGFRNRLNHRIQRAHPNICSFIKCLQGKEARFTHILIQINAGAQGRQKTAATTAIQQRIDTLNECYMNNEIDLQQLLDSLSTVVVKQHK